MAARYREPDREEPVVIELDGPPMAYFELALDYWATPNGELEAENHPEAARLLQRIVYHGFFVADDVRAQTVVTRVTARLKELGGGYIWWRRRPSSTQERSVHLRLGTTPTLPESWWLDLERDVENRDRA